MVASFEVFEETTGVNGTPAQKTQITTGGRNPNQQFRTDDTSTVDNANPIAIPPLTQTNYSYVKSSFMECTVAPSTQVDNMQFFSDGTNNLGTGIDVVLGDQQPTRKLGDTSGYIVATGVVGTSGNEMTTFYTGITTVTSVFTFNPSSTKAISISETGNQITAVGQTTDYLVLQMVVVDTAIPTITPNEIATYQYDEI